MATTLGVAAIWSAFLYCSYVDMKKGSTLPRRFQEKVSVRTVLSRLFRKWRKQFRNQDKSVEPIELKPVERAHELQPLHTTFQMNLSRSLDDSRQLPTMVYEGHVSNPILPPDILESSKDELKAADNTVEDVSTRQATMKKTKRIKRNSKTLRGRMEYRESLKKLCKFADEYSKKMLEDYQNATPQQSKIRTVHMEGLQAYDPFQVQEEDNNWLDMLSSQQA